MIQWYDFAILAILAVLAPILAARGYRKFKQLLAAGDTDVRWRFYRETIVIEWVAVVVLGALWLLSGRLASDLGLGFTGGWRFWLSMALAIVAAIVLALQPGRIRRDSEARAALAERLAHVEEMVPHDERELATFQVLSVTAGICEEIVYRGYAMWLLGTLGGVWLALVGSTVLFSLGHLYQGPKSLGGVALVGLATAGLYLLGGSLWAPMILHVAIDLSSGASSYEAARSRSEPPSDEISG